MNKITQVVELIKTMILNEESIDPLIDTMCKQAKIFGKELKENRKSELKPFFLSNEFLLPFADKYKDLYTNEELETLLEMYKSETISKMLRSSKSILDDLYPEMQKKIESLCM